MFLTVKKNTVLFYLITTILLLGMLFIVMFYNNTSAEENDNNSGGKIIVIDPGHGGIDGGASASDVLEKDLNLSVSLKLRDIINSSGNTAVLTRDTDEVKLGSNGKYVKKVDLGNRLEISDESNADILISIHMNKFTDSQYSGAQVFYSNNSEESKRLGELLQATLKNDIDNANNRVAKSDERNVYILRNSKIPSALIECGFMSNPDELRHLTNPDYQNRLANAINNAISKFFSD